MGSIDPADHAATSHITIKDVAREAGVAVVSVSRALNDQPGVSTKTRQRISEVAQRLGYRPNRHARMLKMGPIRSIALMIKGIGNPFFQQMFDTMESAARAHDYVLSLIKVPHWADEVAEAIRLVDENAAAGIIFLGGNLTHEPAEFARVPVPFVLSTVGDLAGVPRESYASVGVDDLAEARKAVGHLLGLGHRSIAVVGVTSQDASVGRARTQGYEQMLREAGIGVDEALICAPTTQDTDPFTLDHGYSLTLDLLSRRPDVTAIFAESDVLAIGAIRALLDLGLRVPEDVSVMGFDGIELGRFMEPRLTTIAQPVQEIARTTCSLLFDVMAGQPARHIRLPGTLVEGCSAATPRRGPLPRIASRAAAQIREAP